MDFVRSPERRPSLAPLAGRRSSPHGTFGTGDLQTPCHWWAFAALTKSPGARAHYDRRRAAGDSHNAALRNLANKLLGRLWWCLANDRPWDDAAAWRPVQAGAQMVAA